MRANRDKQRRRELGERSDRPAAAGYDSEPTEAESLAACNDMDPRSRIQLAVASNLPESHGIRSILPRYGRLYCV